MITKRIKKRFMGTLLILTVLSHASVGASGRLDQVLASCLEDQTFAVIHLDITKLNAEAFVDRLTNLTKERTGPDTAQQLLAELKRMQMELTAQMDGLIQAGGRDAHLVFSLYDFPYFFVAVPVPSGAKKTQLLTYVQKTAQAFRVGEIETRVSDGVIFIGLKQTIARLKGITPVTSGALAAGTAACPPAGIRAVLFPSSDQRRILMEMLPPGPASNKRHGTTLSNDLNWLALGVDTPPAMSLQMTIQTPDARGADRVLSFIKDLYALVAQHPKVRQIMPSVDQVLSRLTPHTQGEQLVLTLNSTAADSVMDDLLTPLIMRGKTLAMRSACGGHLNNIGRGLLFYANDHNDGFPANLEVLNNTDRITDQTLMCPLVKDPSSYVYRGASVTIADVPTLIMVYERANYHGNGRNVLFMDSHIDWVSEDRFQELIKEDNDYRRKKGLPVLPLE
jgi:prepilin-type processing-associated H-X9-DG protein